jgi:hypothetical protein
VSRWPAETLRIALAPGEVALLNPRGTRVLATHERSVESLLPLLDEALNDPAWRSRRVEVVLSQHFVRHVLTPPPGKALSCAEERALVTSSLREIYGDEATRWNVQVHSQPPQYGLLGAAVDASFAQQLDAMLARHGFRDVTMRPLASFAARHLPKKVQGWWALVEPGWLSLFGGANGVWQHLAGQPVDADWATALPQLIEREAASATLPEMPAVWIQALGVGAVLKPVSDNRRWQVLPHDSQVHGALALAKI